MTAEVYAYDPAKRKTVSDGLRFATLAKCNFRCHYCGAEAADESLVVDHVVPVAVGGLTIPENLVAACKPCNDGKSSRVVDCAPVPASLHLPAHGRGRPTLGGEGQRSRIVQMRWSRTMLEALDAVRGTQSRASFIRAAVAEKLERENGK